MTKQMAEDPTAVAVAKRDQEWRADLVRLIARILLAISILPVVLYLLGGATSTTRASVMLVLMEVGFFLAAFAPRASLHVRGSLLLASLLAFAIVGFLDTGPRPALAMGILLVGVVAYLIFGGWVAGFVLVIVTGLCFSVGALNRETIAARYVTDLAEASVWLRMSLATLAVAGGTLIVVARAMQGRVRAVEALRKQEETLRLHQEEAYRELGQMTRRMDVALDDERRRIARELHDELGQALTAIKLTLKSVKNVDDSDDAAERISDAVSLADQTITSVRELSRLLRPPLLDELGLVAAVRAHLGEQQGRSGVQMHLQASDDPRPAPEIEMAAFRIVQEAVSNVLRHAGARNVEVGLSREAARLVVKVSDDGVGFDVERVREQAARDGHLGLVGIRERARILGGGCTLTSSSGHGTVLRVELPAQGTA